MVIQEEFKVVNLMMPECLDSTFNTNRERSLGGLRGCVGDSVPRDAIDKRLKKALDETSSL